MPNDKLTKAERLRLEALAQTIGTIRLTSEERPTLNDIFMQAETIEAWLKNANMEIPRGHS
jgi:hypothetical protein